MTEPERYRSRFVKIALTPREHAALSSFAAQADLPVARLTGALVRGSLRQMLAEQSEQILDHEAA